MFFAQKHIAHYYLSVEISSERACDTFRIIVSMLK